MDITIPAYHASSAPIAFLDPVLNSYFDGM